MKSGDEDWLEDLARARSESNPGARLLAAARELFNAQGYQVAGINEIIKRAGASKKSFYSYYPGKKQLGAAYLRAEANDFAVQLRRRISRYDRDFNGFARSWAAFLRRQAGKGDFHGCPFASAAVQAHDDFGELLAELHTEWLALMREYILHCKPRIKAHAADTIARRILLDYQGAVMMWRLSGDLRYFDLLAQSLQDLKMNSDDV
ncbi:MAG: TetR/AcrR family transcriptional regulator [Leptospiraceae bacterium]|nr:TetR/AcrR family transcriptional regulator [Leptospiraceae bacterium]